MAATIAARRSGRAPAWQRIGRLAGRGGLLLLLTLVGVGGAVAAFFAAALLSSQPLVLIGAALLVQVAVTGGLAWWAARPLGLTRRGRGAAALAVGITLGTTLLAAGLLGRPLAGPAAPGPAPAGVAYWDLPTGSHIAYLVYPAAPAPVPPRPPIIRVHGGPGAYAVASTLLAGLYQDLTRAGFTVYTYDQIGSGLSARLPNPRDYTVDRHVADLEAIRRQIGAEQVILTGDSWGATLVANYMAVHPERVAKAIFTSPAPIEYAEWRAAPWQDLTARLPEAQRTRINAWMQQPRFLALMALSGFNPLAAYHFAPDAEMDSFFSAWVGPMLPGMICDPARFPPDAMQPGFGFWANVMTGSDAGLQLRGRRAALASNHTPALILKGECDYIQWAVADQYRTTLPAATLLYVPQAGHVIYFDRPALYSAAVRAFLLDQPLPLPPYRGDGTAPAPDAP